MIDLIEGFSIQEEVDMKELFEQLIANQNVEKGEIMTPIRYIKKIIDGKLEYQRVKTYLCVSIYIYIYIDAYSNDAL